MRWTSVIRTAAGLMGALACVAPSAPAAVETLTGEELLGTPVITESDCVATGPSSFTYSVSGLAFGPYPGVFSETGTVTLDGQGPAIPTSFFASFTITPSPDDPMPTFREVSGTKEIGDPTAGEAACGLDPLGLEEDRFVLFVTHRYEAQIRTTDGTTCTDRGVGSIQMLLFREGPLESSEFREDFTSDATSGEATCPGGGGDDDDQGEDDDDQGEDDDDQGEDDDDQGEDEGLPGGPL